MKYPCKAVFANSRHFYLSHDNYIKKHKTSLLSGILHVGDLAQNSLDYAIAIKQIQQKISFKSQKSGFPGILHYSLDYNSDTIIQAAL